MAVVGSTIMVDLHLTEDADIETVRGVVRQGNDQVHPDLGNRIHRTVQTQATRALDGDEVGDYTLSIDVDLVAGRVPGAPRERVTVALDVEAEDAVLAAVDQAVGAPDRAQIADEVEVATKDYLREHELHQAVDVTVSVTPIQFR